ncbi:MAG: hypothetical protein KDK62_05140 [Chlamydiia bacterium]|nr:hypothetical protein [Chlamydiia bacterium]
MSKLLTRALQLETEYNHKEHSTFLRGLKVHLKYMPLLVWTKIYSGASKQLFFGLTTAMEGIYTDEGKLGVFSPDLRKLSETVAKGLLIRVDVENEGLEMKKRLLGQLFTGAMTTMVGLLELARENTKGKLHDEGVNHFTAMLTRGIISSEIPKSTLKSIAEALELNDRFSEDALETCVLLIILKAFLPKEEAGQLILFEAMQERLIKNFETLEKELTDNRVNAKKVAPLNLFLKEGKALLTQGNHERFLKEINKCLTAYDLNPELLNQDTEAMKSLFGVLKGGFEAQEKGTRSQVNLIG